MDREALLKQYASGYDDLVDALAGADVAELDRAPAPDAWTVRQIVHHVADGEANGYVRLRRLLAEDSPTLPNYDERQWAAALRYDRPIEHSLAFTKSARDASFGLLQVLSEHDWQRSGTHTERGTYTMSDWLVDYAEHPHIHADQIRRARQGRV
jgi:hypothetical protein